jgi:hypothetical protein
MTIEALNKVIGKSKIKVFAEAQKEIDKAKPNDVLAVRIGINSPKTIHAVANVTRDENALFKISE